jgi:HSP20 family protein
VSKSAGGGGDESSAGGGLLGNLTELIKRLGELAEKGEELRRSGEFKLDPDGALRGMFGVTIRTGTGPRGERTGFKVEPFGNVKPDKASGQPVVQSEIEPVTDLFEEDDHLLITAEMPGIGEEDVRLHLEGRTLTIEGTNSLKSYRKVVELPRACDQAGLTYTCRNGVLQVKLVG